MRVYRSQSSSEPQDICTCQRAVLKLVRCTALSSALKRRCSQPPDVCVCCCCCAPSLPTCVCVVAAVLPASRRVCVLLLLCSQPPDVCVCCCCCAPSLPTCVCVCVCVVAAVLPASRRVCVLLLLCSQPPHMCVVAVFLHRLRLFPDFLQQEEADWMFSTLLAELPWSQKTNYRQGESYEEPRLTCWYGELPYTYSNSTLRANTEWHPVLSGLRSSIESHSGGSFNSLLCNMYRDGRDSIAWHSDNEPSLGTRPTIASLSLGDTRVFSLRKQPPPEENGDYTYVDRLRIPLAHGSLLMMEGCTQDDWQHQVAKEYHDRGPRINLTFRTIYPEP
ncbi:alpha-ketoglutarate-dependent dioxygenase alkB homolog 3 isoform X1 [Alosa pseudoharengus]|uniref:alpha-ketoglutarate-dependent dioxygenase alkB homolog 3 isoform X1 n=1 Tax=Alosa pseudoharengus TaxID=34774 RepID=UPI003F8B3B1E